MEAQISTSDNHIQKAWHIAAVLLTVGRPASPAELAGKCNIFRTSPDFVEFVCFIPNSPLCMSRNGAVLLSSAAFRAIGEFFAVSMIPEVKISSFGASTSSYSGFNDAGSNLRKYFKKRRRFRSDRAVIRSIEGKQEKERFGSNDVTALALEGLALDAPWEVTLRLLSENDVTSSMAAASISRLLERQSKNGEVEDIYSCVRSKKHQDEYNDNNGTILDMPKAQEEGSGSLFFESLAEISAFLGVDEPEPLDMITKMDTSGSPCRNLDQHDKNTSLKAAVAFHPQEDFITKQIHATMIEDMVVQPVNDNVHEERAERDKHDKNTSVKAHVASDPHKDFISKQVPETMIEDMVEKPVTDNGFHEERTEKEKHEKNKSVQAPVASDFHEVIAIKQVSETVIKDMVEHPLNDKCFHEERTEKEKHDKNMSLKAPVTSAPHEDIITKQIPETMTEDMVEQPLTDNGFHGERTEKEKHDKNTPESPVHAVVTSHPHEDFITKQVPETMIEVMVEQPLTDNSFHGERTEKEKHDKNTPVHAVVTSHPHEDFITKQVPETMIEVMVEQPLNDNAFHEEKTKKEKRDKNTPAKAPLASDPHEDIITKQAPETMIEDIGEQPLTNDGFHEEKTEKEKHSLGSCGVGAYFENILCSKTIESPTNKQPALQDGANDKASNQALIPAKSESNSQKTPSKNAAVPKDVPQLDPTLKQKAQPKLLRDKEVVIFDKDRRGQKVQNAVALRDNNKQIVRNSDAEQEKCADKSSKDQQKSNYPEFELYTVEEEEGSGGYGTVYRARRKTDGVIFAIKCPHENAHIHHLKNEQRMLQRFGGKSFVINFEGSVKSGNADCFVLEHVDHDRPEALKKEIDIYQLQWYGYCLFKALSSLHKQGVFHRDVKPGNFLFSCKTTKGYLVDFNLAKDIQKQPGTFDQSQLDYMTTTEYVPARQHKLASPKRRKLLKGKHCEALKARATSVTYHTPESRTLKRKAVDKLKAYDELGRRKSVNSHGAEGSGLTSKDLTSTRTSGERLREPVPCRGRKELINMAQEAMQNPGSAAVLKRKRVAASPVIMDRKFVYVTPTPLHSSGNCISGAGPWKSTVVKPPKEGPCVGTKGFRAPEVLLRSSYQGPNIDVWSAGVTLLYLITGKLPFTGDPEQNMKDIVKLKGNEELWEVAKLHSRESSFPEELLDIRFLQSMTIKEWCIANTKRTKFVDIIPESLFDLIEKCLTVNPRLRITAEEALRHKFFAPCHNALQALKSRRLSQNQQSRSNSLPMLREPVGTSY